MLVDILIQEFKAIFWDAFHRPKLASEKMHSVWLSLEPMNDYLAGPLFAIYENGNCDYLFRPDAPLQEIKTN